MECFPPADFSVPASNTFAPEIFTTNAIERLTMEHSYFLRNSAAWAALILLLGAASVSAQYGSASNPIPADWIEYQDKTEEIGRASCRERVLQVV